MGFPKYIFIILSFFILFFQQKISSQTIFKELSGSQDSTALALIQSKYKNPVILLNGTWQLYKAEDEKKKKTEIEIPSVFEDDGNFVFEKEFYISEGQIKNFSPVLHFDRLSYYAEISVNDIIIYRFSGGEFPFDILIPKDILKTAEKNTLAVKLLYKLDAQTTIPLKQRFLYPLNLGGIFGNVYILLRPNLYIKDYTLNSLLSSDLSSVKINLAADVLSNDKLYQSDSTQTNSIISLQLKVTTPTGNELKSKQTTFSIKLNDEISVNTSLEIPNPVLWSPENPKSYLFTIELYSSNLPIDQIQQPFSLYSLKISNEKISLNGKGFSFNGVTYMPSLEDFGQMLTYKEMQRDIKLIKDLGFNAVRFSKSVPNQYYLKLCEEYGLLAFVELPLSFLPDNLAESQYFKERVSIYLNGFLNSYKNYSVIAAFGLGSNYLPDLNSHSDFISNFAREAKKYIPLTYASFAKARLNRIENLDLYGIEFLNDSPADFEDLIKLSEENIGKARVFISEAGYIASIGKSNGYLNKFSLEAQAKYFEELIKFADKKHITGYFINSMFDYRGNYPSIISGYNESNLYPLGIAGEDRSTNRMSYKVIYSLLHNSEKVTIPLGSKKDDAPMSFILIGLVLAFLVGALVNSGRKFREDASRALLRPYNFFSDIRDQRLISGFHTAVLFITIALTYGLICSNILFRLRTDIIIEKFLLAFGSANLLGIVSKLAWNPVLAVFEISAITIIKLLVLSLILKFASLFLRNKVPFQSIFFMVVWSLLPTLLLIPVGLVLYRILNLDVANLYIYSALILFLLWNINRLLKGIYVIFDVNSTTVYVYFLLIIFIVGGGILFYYQSQYNLFDYVMLIIKQYKLLG